MAEQPDYAILGSGYWAARMKSILAESHAVTSLAGARSRPQESAAAYIARLSQSFKSTGAQVAWICVPPGPHIPAMAEAALQAGLHVIVEKPWLNSRTETQPLQQLASRNKLLLGVHYQYCLLDTVENWRRNFNSGAGLEFGGRFTTSRPNRLGLDAMDNLGSHLIAIWNYAVPQALLSEIKCGYDTADAREAWLKKGGRRLASIDFLHNSEPIIQRFITTVERVIAGAPFPFGIDFALRVTETTEALKLKPRD